MPVLDGPGSAAPPVAARAPPRHPWLPGTPSRHPWLPGTPSRHLWLPGTPPRYPCAAAPDSAARIASR
ncbi:hypothetical protein GCM10010499_46420 [Streptomyces thermoviolaceus subsp. apingens]|nr:hypothetical protein GCM10010499_46420 [Streptomyces thermoviolaceus subsp. apingens]